MGLYCSVPCKNKDGRKTPEQSFWGKVRKANLNACWLWIGARDRRGYGNFAVHGTGHLSAHRFSYELHHGAIPKGLYVLHKCDVPRCVNPKHLWAGTASENTLDMFAKGRNPKNPRHLLSREKAAVIRQRYAAGVLQKELAKEFGVTQAAISYLLLGHSYKPLAEKAA